MTYFNQSGHKCKYPLHQQTRWRTYPVTVRRAVRWINPLHCCINCEVRRRNTGPISNSKSIQTNLPELACHDINPKFNLSQLTTKPTKKPVCQSKIQISLYIHKIRQGFSFIPIWIAWGCRRHMRSGKTLISLRVRAG